MKARADGGACPSCGTAIFTGQQIGLVGHQWHHTACLTGHKVPMIGLHSGK
jgi:hypothetical protein